MNFPKSTFALLIAATMSNAHAASLTQAEAIQSKTNQASAASQQRVDHSAEATLSHKAEIEQLKEEVKNLDIYRNHLKAMVSNQQQEQISLQTQIEEIKQTRQGIVPLMYQMIDGLKTTIENDRPIKKEQRTERVAKLEALMSRADVSEAEKYRRILEAYQIEMDYGTKLGAYQGQIQIQDQTLEADILYLGRVSLVARSLNGNQFWVWNQKDKAWQELDSSYKSELNNAFSIAHQQTAPGLITLPVSAMEAQQ